MPLSKDHLSGLYTAIVTPLRADGSVDVKALQTLVRFQLDAGASGIVPIGGTGEYPAFSRSERRVIVSACVEAAQGKPVIPGRAVDRVRGRARGRARLCGGRAPPPS
jgi:4-hydroxy-tetrahydrodipicolinate synthase